MSEAEAVKHVTPKIGDTVLVRHRSKSNKRGESCLEVSKPVVDVVVQVMLDGDVKVKCGDVWQIKKAADSKTVWMTTGMER